MPDRRIIVVENEEVLCHSIRQYFEQRERALTVISAASPTEALFELDDPNVDLVVSVHQGSEGVNALALLEGMRGQNLPVRTIILADANLSDDMNDALVLGCTTFLVRPVSENRLLDLIYNMLQPDQGFAGRLIGMRLEDILQMLCYRRESTLVTVFSKENRVGSIYISEGGIIHADCDDNSGVDAAYEILGWDQSEFYSQVVFQVPQQTIFMDSRSLLVEGMRQKDEILHALQPPTPTPAIESYGADARNSRSVQPTGRPDRPPKRIMVVDDSRFVRKVIDELLKDNEELTIAGHASNGLEALEKIGTLKPDLILLDWDMPIMKGGTALMHIMLRSPCPVVVFSGFLGTAGQSPLDLLRFGGVDFLAKPKNNWRSDGQADDLVRRLKEACEIKFDRIRRVRPPLIATRTSSSDFKPAEFLSVLGSFIGGCSDLFRIIPFLPEGLPSTLVVIHDIQLGVVDAFVNYLNARSRISVRRLELHERLLHGVCYIHPATVSVELVQQEGYITAKKISGSPSLQALDHFLVSASKIMKEKLIAGLLSGGGGYGIKGLKAVKRMNGITMVQIPALCVNPGMAEAALKEGLVDYTCSADMFHELIMEKAIGMNAVR